MHAMHSWNAFSLMKSAIPFTSFVGVQCRSTHAPYHARCVRQSCFVRSVLNTAAGAAFTDGG